MDVRLAPARVAGADYGVMARHAGLQGPDGVRGEVLRLEGWVQVSQVRALHALCVAGWGISLGVTQDDRRALADGRRLPVLALYFGHVDGRDASRAVDGA
ncbi:hypothetical protein [Polaromonas glacialis]|uniref:hypothetical protein n=1 Tax=Polaromonas glacialis TaxID=866564 RepID=UPI000A7A34E3|nr:hypothetical protein [Polaromonas glacialis]